ncbi:unnamed protein product [Notodromas monacha]|uniref:Uncharacterized protein n=1 Tax=Notodromas monacha TaxID=399045 RepID=A0A7R9GF38_9CRUS|nr:unnamed protein product [Notodromas monacha]CAG0918711.1 unnamed protein product [Notodromas monacha]
MTKLSLFQQMPPSELFLQNGPFPAKGQPSFRTRMMMMMSTSSRGSSFDIDSIVPQLSHERHAKPSDASCENRSSFDSSIVAFCVAWKRLWRNIIAKRTRLRIRAEGIFCRVIKFLVCSVTLGLFAKTIKVSGTNAVGYPSFIQSRKMWNTGVKKEKRENRNEKTPGVTGEFLWSRPGFSIPFASSPCSAITRLITTLSPGSGQRKRLKTSVSVGTELWTENPADVSIMSSHWAFVLDL